MPPSVTFERVGEISARAKARTSGVLYLLIFIVAPVGARTATPARMIATLACDTSVALIFYVLFRPVSKRLSLLAAIFRLLLVAIMSVASLNYFGGLNLFHAGSSAGAFDKLDAVSLVPFGVHCLLIGYLIFKSSFLPRLIGVLMGIAGVAWLTFLSPSFAHHACPYNLIAGALGEGALTLWLLIAGLNEQRWRECAAQAAKECSSAG